MNIKKAWEFILDQHERCKQRMVNKSYRDAVDLIYDIAGNISNLYKFIEEGNITTDKGKVLNNLSLMYTKGIFKEDLGRVLRDKWQLRNIAKYGYFASPKIDIESVEIPETEIQNLFSLVEKMLSQFEKYLEGKNVK